MGLSLINGISQERLREIFESARNEAIRAREEYLSRPEVIAQERVIEAHRDRQLNGLVIVPQPYSTYRTT